MRKYKVTFYMKSGNKVTIRCDAFELPKLSGDGARVMSLTNSSSTWSIDIDQVEAWKVCRLLTSYTTTIYILYIIIFIFL